MPGEEAMSARDVSGPSTTGFDHFAPTASDAEASAAWYAEVFGLERLAAKVPHHGDSSPGHAILLRDPLTNVLVGVHQHVESLDGPFDERRPGLDHMAWGVASRPELERWAEWLDQLQIEHSGITDVTGQRSYAVIVFRDPDNVQLELIARSAEVGRFGEDDVLAEGAVVLEVEVGLATAAEPMYADGSQAGGAGGESADVPLEDLGW
jgi:catechol 2,3-dioxygenase-like lactoylglutathione lyase family enzyme